MFRRLQSLFVRFSSQRLVFPLAEIPNIRRFYLIAFLTNVWFATANYLFFVLRFISFGQFGLIEAASFVFGLVMEVPTGAIADLIGKKKSVVTGLFFWALGLVMFAFSSNAWQLIGALLTFQLGLALYSGAAEALVYDTLVDHQQADKYDQVVSASYSLIVITETVAIIIGGLLYAWHFRLANAAWAAGAVLAFLVSLGLREPAANTTDSFSIKSYALQLIEGTKMLASDKLRRYLPVILALLGSFFIFEWGIIRSVMALEFGFLDRGQAVLFTIYGLATTVIVKMLPWIRSKISDYSGIYGMGLLMGLAFMLSYFSYKWLGAVSMLVITLVGFLAYPWISVVINRDIPSKYRATTLSTVAFLTKLPYALLAIVAGLMAEVGQMNLFNFWLGLVIFGTVSFGLIGSVFQFFGKSKS